QTDRPATTDVSPLSLHDALPLYPPGGSRTVALAAAERVNAAPERTVIIGRTGTSRHYGGFAFVAGVDDFAEAVVRDRYRTVSARSEEHTSELQSRENLVCRLPLE